MDVVYSFVESIHVFIPVIAVVSCIFIIFCCGVRGSQQPPDEYLEKIKKLEDRPKRKSKVKPLSSKLGFVPAGPGPKQPSGSGAELRQRSALPFREQTTKNFGADEESVPTENWVEVPKKKRKEKKPIADAGEREAVEHLQPESITVASTEPVAEVASEVSVSARSKEQQVQATANDSLDLDDEGFDQPAMARKKQKNKKQKPPTAAAAAFDQSELAVKSHGTAAVTAVEVEESSSSAAVYQHLSNGGSSRNSRTPDEASSTASQKSTTSTTTSSNKTFEQVPLHVGSFEEPLEEETADDDFVLVSARRPDAAADGKSSSKRKKKAKKNQIEEIAFTIEPFIPAIASLKSEPEVETISPEDTGAASASAAAEDVEEDLGEEEGDDDSELNAAKKKKKKKKTSKKHTAGAPADASQSGGGSDQENEVTDDFTSEGLDVPEDSEGAAQKKKRRARRDV